MGHAHQRVIKHLGKNTVGGPNQTTNAPQGACEGCEKGKSKRLPFPTSKSRATRPLNLVHSDLNEMPDFWIYAVKAKLHTYNVTPIKRADYKTPTELCSGKKPNISHLRVFGCQAWVHILKRGDLNSSPRAEK